MSKDPYLTLGISENATQAEIDDAYLKLYEKYSNERFMEGADGEYASRKLGEIKEAYDEAMSRAKKASFISEGHDDLYEAEEALKEGKLDEAQRFLDDNVNRNGKWHYLQAHLYYKRGWLVECKKQLEIAIKTEPSNDKYKRDYDRLLAEMNPAHVFGDGKTVSGTHPSGRSYTGERTEADACCDSCGTCLCMNLLCNCCGS